ncbi:peptide-methionine (S)-S-oxide reductase MsrA [uncultured Ilyobacter sp.]|uniref:peptide-methionine (S)-S-oxide reductase MsrA n=1 Tax=uncultured Ilyobacter sp. TaxID=544433 RepID=UPI0029F52F58|nr:peptide-methionine (S)-S-oxide reductase MsrA [uncultured Ilyobacter sp.]
MKTITLAGGCFWGIEAYFKRVKGVVHTTVGYSNGTKKNPDYKEVCSGKTGHAEVCKVEYDESILPLTKLLDHFFRLIDPTVLNRQGNDTGTQYRTGVYYSSEDDLSEISDFIKSIAHNWSSEIVTEIEPLHDFFPAEEYHQEYLEKNPSGYCHINFSLLKDEEKQEPV